MNCPKCSSVAVAPEGITGEKVCPTCGLVINKPLVAGGFNQWNPQWHSHWRETDSETLKEWLTTLRTVSCQLNLPRFPYREEAARTIRKGNRLLTQSQKFGKNKRATIAALIHLTLKEYDKNRPLKEIAQELGLNNTLVMKQAWILNKALADHPKQVLSIRRKSATDHLYELGGKLTSDNTLLDQAGGVLVRIRRTGGNPTALAAGALYYTCKSNRAKISKEQIGQAFQISYRTVYTNEAKIRTLLGRDNDSAIT